MKVKNQDVPTIYRSDVKDTGKYSPATNSRKKERRTTTANAMSKVRVTVFAGMADQAR